MLAYYLDKYINYYFYNIKTHMKYGTNHNIDMFMKGFILYGMFGICSEVIFTSLTSNDRHGISSPLLFPVYGLITLQQKMITKYNYSLVPFMTIKILIGEYISGKLLNYINYPVWYYNDSCYHIEHIVNLSYIPYWIIFSIFIVKLNQIFLN